MSYTFKKSSLGEFNELDRRSQEIFRQLVEQYLQTGTPVGSRKLARDIPLSLSPASIRNIMADMEDLGLLYAPHVSAGRVPTEKGLRFFVDALLEVGDISEMERKQISGQMPRDDKNRSVEDILTEATDMLSGLSQCAGLIMTGTKSNRLKHIEFVSLEPERALAILVNEDGNVENRVIALKPGIPPSALIEAANFLNSRLIGKSLEELQREVLEELKTKQTMLDDLTTKVVEAGLASWSGEAENKNLIVRGRSNLLEGEEALEDIERIRTLFDELEEKKNFIDLLELTESAEGVRIFIGSENKLFSLSGSSFIAAPCVNEEQKIIGALGIIGPTRINYGRIIPMVNYTAQLVSKIIS